MDRESKSQVGYKIKTVEELCSIIGPRPRSKKVIMCHGTFDIVHPGHVRHLLYAKTKGDILVRLKPAGSRPAADDREPRPGPPASVPDREGP